MRAGAWLALTLTLLLVAGPAAAQWRLDGHAKYQVSQQRFPADSFGARVVATPATDNALNGRLNVTYRHRRLDVTASGELSILQGDTIAAVGSSTTGAASIFLPGLPDLYDTHQWLDLGTTRSLGDDARLFARLDRLSVGYAGDRFVARVGRQALSWGNGLVFQTLDLFNPFPPNVLDLDYKPGRDMVTTQWLLPSGDDLQALVVPGRAARGQPLARTESSAAFKWHHVREGMELDLLVARHHGETVVGGGVSRSVAQGVLRVDLSHARQQGRQVTSMLANFDHAWTPGGRTLYLFGEYFYNGFGVEAPAFGPVVVNADLLARFERGELFTLGRHEVAGGARLEWTPLLTLSPTTIVSLTDGSAFALAQVEYSWRQNLVLFAGLQAGIGGQGSEYGGMTVDGLPGDLSPGTRVWARLAQYF